jgi:hypothetical protein
MQQAALPFDAATVPDPPDLPALLFVRHPRARRYIVSVRTDGVVRVTVPRRGSKREAEAFAASQRGWIEKQLRRIEERSRVPQPPAIDPEELRALRARAARELPARLLELAAAHGLAVRRVSVRNQQWRWGSCSRAGRICLNWRLVQMPAWVRDYVMLHELMHLKRMDHSKQFWTLVANVCPEYQAARKYLRDAAHRM